MLAYLSARPGRRATRDHLIDTFWANTSVTKAGGSVRQTLHKLRSVLGASLSTENATGEIVLSDVLTTDRDEFLTALSSNRLDDAVALYTGPFCPGFASPGSAAFEQWSDAERDRLHDLYAGALEVVAQRLIELGEPKRAATLAQRLIDHNPLDERGWRLRLDAEMAGGSRLHVTSSIAELQRLLALDGTNAEPKTRHLIERLSRSPDAANTDRKPDALVADLVGREKEFGELQRGWRAALSHNAHHVHVRGAAGVGKSRLLDDLAARLETTRARVVRMRATPRQRTSVAGPLSSLVAMLANLPGAPGLSAPYVQVLFTMQPAIGMRFPHATPRDIDDPDERRRIRTDALAELITVVSEERPLCMLLDDLHWWDSYSSKVVGDAIERVTGKPVLTVTASRPGSGEVNTSISSKPLSLRPLSRDEVASIISSLGESSDSGAIDLLSNALHVATDGVPLLIIECLRLGIDREAMSLQKGRWTFAHVDAYLATLHPGSALRDRIGLLTASQREVLRCASVLEAPVHSSLFRSPDIHDPAQILFELEQTGMLMAQGNSWVVTHDLIAQFAIESSTEPEVQRTHSWAAACSLNVAKNEEDFTGALHHALDANDLDMAAQVCSAWLTRCRAQADKRPGATIVRSLLAGRSDEPQSQALIKQTPRDSIVSRWPPQWGWLLAAAICIFAIGVGWRLTSPETEPDATLGVFSSQDDTATQFSVPVRANHWRRGPRDLSMVHAKGGAGVFPTNRANLNDAPIASPDGEHWLASHVMTGAAGPTELFLISADGSERELAPAHGDDISPNWAPDGQSAAFTSTRWSAPGNATFHIGVVNINTGAVRQLTNSASAEEHPIWSPDGTRIAYIKRPAELAPEQLCWIAIDGGTEHCITVVPTLEQPIGWIDSRTILAKVMNGPTNQLTLIKIDDGAQTVVFSASVGDASLSPDAEWVACVCRVQSSPNEQQHLIVFPVHQPDAVHTIANLPNLESTMWFWHPSRFPPWLSQLKLIAPANAIALDADYRISVTGVASDGSALEPVGLVMRWRIGDAAIAAIDSVTGDVHPRNVGTTWVWATAGGWRSDSTQITVGGAHTVNLLSESWSADWRDRWERIGPVPLPEVVTGKHIGPGITPNGDGTYVDMVYSKTKFAVEEGLGIEAMVETPITRTKWQRIGMYVIQVTSTNTSGLAGSACGMQYPIGEGWSGLKRLGTAGGIVTPPPGMSEGRPVRVRVQYFPDGTCGVAIDGKPISRGKVEMHAGQLASISLGGQSVGTHMMVGALTVWRGVKNDVDWSGVGH